MLMTGSWKLELGNVSEYRYRDTTTDHARTGLIIIFSFLEESQVLIPFW
jgi:hypothetical protein